MLCRKYRKLLCSVLLDEEGVSWFCCQLQLPCQFRSLWGSLYIQYLSILIHSFLKCEVGTIPTSEGCSEDWQYSESPLVYQLYTDMLQTMPIHSDLTQPHCCYSWSCRLEMWAGLRGVCSFLLYVVLVRARVAQCLPTLPLPPCGFYPPGSFSLHYDLSVQWGRLDFLAWHWNSKSGSPRKPFLWHSIGQSKSPSQPRLQGMGKQTPPFDGKNSKVTLQLAWI